MSNQNLRYSQGDVDGTNTIGTADITRMKSHLNGIDGWILTGDSLERADVNNNGSVIENDITYLANYMLQKPSANIDKVEISGTFKFKRSINESSDIETNLPIINTDGSFTSTTVTTSEDGDYTIVSVDYVFDNSVYYYYFKSLCFYSHY